MFGLTFLFVNALYLLFAIVVGVISYIVFRKKDLFKKQNRKWISVGVFLMVLFLPFYDLFIQKGIKTYYQVFKMDSTIYAYPEKDENGKIESLGVDRVVHRKPVDYLITNKDLDEFKKKSYVVSEFIEYYFFDSYKKNIDKDRRVTYKPNYREDFGYARVFFNKMPISYEKLEDESEYEARYQVMGKDDSTYFYNKTVVEFWDLKNDKLFATAFRLDFYTDNYDENFRNKYLLFRGPSGVALSIKGLDNRSEIMYKLFKIIL